MNRSRNQLKVAALLFALSSVLLIFVFIMLASFAITPPTSYVLIGLGVLLIALGVVGYFRALRNQQGRK